MVMHHEHQRSHTITPFVTFQTATAAAALTGFCSECLQTKPCLYCATLEEQGDAVNKTHSCGSRSPACRRRQRATFTDATRKCERDIWFLLIHSPLALIRHSSCPRSLYFHFTSSQSKLSFSGAPLYPCLPLLVLLFFHPLFV